MAHVLEFEEQLEKLRSPIRELTELARVNPAIAGQLAELTQQFNALGREMLEALSPLEKVQLSRHPNRPYTLDYVQRLMADWVELHGDRRFGDDASIVGGLGTLGGRSVVLVGHQKGRGTKDNVKRNFGMPNPEGYRKAIRLYEMAERFRLPIVTLIDTPGAYPGIGAEERGQAEAIAAAIEAMARATVPIIATVIGEGGSGGALALGVGNVVQVLQYGYYSVISPEGCAAILWKDPSKAGEAAAKLRITAPHLLEMGLVDHVVEEPPGGAHQDPDLAAAHLGRSLTLALARFDGMSADAIREQRYVRFRKLGAVAEPA